MEPLLDMLKTGSALINGLVLQEEGVFAGGNSGLLTLGQIVQAPIAAHDHIVDFSGCLCT